MCREFAGLRFGAGAGRIDDGGVEAFEVRACKRSAEEIALFDGDGLEALRLAGCAIQ